MPMVSLENVVPGEDEIFQVSDFQDSGRIGLSVFNNFY
jgi:hypothetical protein